MVANDPKVKAALMTAERILRESQRMQEEAAERILGLAERIIETSDSKAVRLQAEAIMEACSFQDLSGQRLNKVARLMKFLQSPDATLKVAQAEKNQQAFETGGGLSQEQVDALLNGASAKKIIGKP